MDPGETCGERRFEQVVLNLKLNMAVALLTQGLQQRTVKHAWSQEQKLRPPDIGTQRKSAWGKGEGPRVPACQAWPLPWPRVLVPWVGGQALGGHSHVNQGGPAFQLSGNIWWSREAQSSFHTDQPALNPGPEAS